MIVEDDPLPDSWRSLAEIMHAVVRKLEPEKQPEKETEKQE